MEAEEISRIVRDTVNAVLDERNRVDAEKHAADHEFIALLRRREARKQEIWVSVKKNVIGFLLVSALTGLGGLIWHGFQDVIDKPPSHNEPGR